MSNPLVSFLVPMYNAASGIAATLQSILGQTYEHFEVIIVDDGSTDGSPEIAAKILRQAKITSKKNGGIVSALNLGLRSCQGKYVARLDCYDQALPERLDEQVAILERDEEIGLVGGQIILFDERGDIGVSRYPTDPEEIKHELLRGHSAIVHSAATMRRDLLIKVGGYDLFYEGMEDFDLFAKFSLVGKLGNAEKVVSKVQSIPSGLTFNGAYLAPLFELALYEREERKKNGLDWRADSLRKERLEKVHELKKSLRTPGGSVLLSANFYAMRGGLMLRSGERLAAMRDYWRSLSFTWANWRSLIGLALCFLMPLSVYKWGLRSI